ncbi:MAG: gamma-glutamyl-gamma-aminobutyrate hydrolase family protein, partial [Defluviitaleaceae bacterium]|nr:gamma-glutamyl-gamma-aminobutyrate hydrolase family protein [Defluviitaleaceae bacterium]
GFGSRGIEGKVAACQYARENNTPFLGICLGMHMAVVEFARNVCGLTKANSTEFDEATDHPVIHIMPDQVGLLGTGGTMRVGAYPCRVSEGSLLAKLYNTTDISERHRHRFEFNNDFRETLTSKGLAVSGIFVDGNLVEAIELPTHPFYIGVQFHPEFKSRPNRPHPLFMGLLEATVDKK